MDKASRALAQGVPPGVPKSYRALADHSQVPASTLHHRARGRRSIEDKAKSQQYLADWEEDALVQYLLQSSDLGHPVRIKFIPLLAFCLARYRNESERPPKPPGKNWSKAFQDRHKEVQARRVKALDWNRHEKNIYNKVVHWFEVIKKVLDDPAILAENVYNMDETGVMLSMLGSVKVLVSRSDMRNYRGARVKREAVTAIECISADGRYLNPMIIWPASTHRSNWTTFETPGWQYALSDSGYTDSYISLQWLKLIFDPETKAQATHISGELKPRVLICDGFGTHETIEIQEFCLLNSIILCRLPSHSSHKTQPCDVATFAPLKAAYREQVERLERGGVNKIGKEHFTSLYSPARIKAFTSRNIKAGFAACGLFPFNPDRVLSSMSKPPDLITSELDNGMIRPCQPALPEQLEDGLLQSPTTPVSAGGFASLKDMIVQQNTHARDETGRWRLHRLIQKLGKAAQMSFAKGILQHNHIRFLMTINNEAKVRRSTKPIMLGTARIMSYQDLVEARAKRAEKDAAKEAKGKGKRGRKRKAVALETEVSQAEPVEPTAKKMRTSEVLDVEQSQSVPVARMY